MEYFVLGIFVGIIIKRLLMKPSEVEKLKILKRDVNNLIEQAEIEKRNIRDEKSILLLNIPSTSNVNDIELLDIELRYLSRYQYRLKVIVDREDEL